MKKSFKFLAVAMAVSLCACGGMIWGVHTYAQATGARNATEFEREFGIPHDDGKTLIESATVYLGEMKSSTKDMCLTLETRTNYVTVDGVKYIDQLEIAVSYEWLKKPAMTKHDDITVFWDKNAFTFWGDSFYSYDTDTSEAGLENFAEQGKKFEQARPMGIDLGSLTYQARLSLSGKGKKPCGYAHFVLKPAKSPMWLAQSLTADRCYTTSITVSYQHNRKMFGKNIIQKPAYSWIKSKRVDTAQAGLNCYYSYE